MRQILTPLYAKVFFLQSSRHLVTASELDPAPDLSTNPGADDLLAHDTPLPPTLYRSTSPVLHRALMYQRKGCLMPPGATTEQTHNHLDSPANDDAAQGRYGSSPVDDDDGYYQPASSHTPNPTRNDYAPTSSVSGSTNHDSSTAGTAARRGRSMERTPSAHHPPPRAASMQPTIGAADQDPAVARYSPSARPSSAYHTPGGSRGAPRSASVEPAPARRREHPLMHRVRYAVKASTPPPPPPCPSPLSGAATAPTTRPSPQLRQDRPSHDDHLQNHSPPPPPLASRPDPAYGLQYPAEPAPLTLEAIAGTDDLRAFSRGASLDSADTVGTPVFGGVSTHYTRGKTDSTSARWPTSTNYSAVHQDSLTAADAATRALSGEIAEDRMLMAELYNSPVPGPAPAERLADSSGYDNRESDHGYSVTGGHGAEDGHGSIQSRATARLAALSGGQSNQSSRFGGAPPPPPRRHAAPTVSRTDATSQSQHSGYTGSSRGRVVPITRTFATGAIHQPQQRAAPQARSSATNQSDALPKLNKARSGSLSSHEPPRDPEQEARALLEGLGLRPTARRGAGKSGGVRDSGLPDTFGAAQRNMARRRSGMPARRAAPSAR